MSVGPGLLLFYATTTTDIIGSVFLVGRWRSGYSGRGNGMGDPLVGELSEFQTQFGENRVTARDICEPLTREAFNWRPADGRWSVAECLGHLNISATLFGEAALRAAQTARSSGRVATRPFRHGALSRLILWSLDPDNRRRLKAPRRLVPPPTDYDVQVVLEEFVASQRRWEACLEAANGLDLVGVKVPSPAMPLLRFSLGATFAIQVTHERRHLHQARRVTTTRGFPASPVEDS